MPGLTAAAFAQAIGGIPAVETSIDLHTRGQQPL
jgi:hypothetical protein